MFNNEACLGEVEEAKAASDMKFDSLASEIESLKKEFDRLEGFSGRSDSRSMVQKVEKFVWNKDKEILFVNELNSAEMQNTLEQALHEIPNNVNNALDLFVNCVTSASHCMKKTFTVGCSTSKMQNWFDKKKKKKKSIDARRKTRSKLRNIDTVRKKLIGYFM